MNKVAQRVKELLEFATTDDGLDELEALYGIEIYADRAVYDPVDDKEYDSFKQWAQEAAEFEFGDRLGHVKSNTNTPFEDY